MPALSLSKVERELVRQWILYDCPLTGNVVDTNLLSNYYNGFGIQAISSPPNPPHADSGFQIK